MNDIVHPIDQITATVPSDNSQVQEPVPHYARTTYKIDFNPPQHAGVPIWLISMTDLMGIVLTFFVLLFTMSAQNTEDKGDAQPEQFVAGGLNTSQGAAGNAGDQDTISINKIDFNQSLNLSYLKSVIENLSEQNPELKKARLIEEPENKRLIVTLPHDLLFEKGKAEMNAEGKIAVGALTSVLKNIPNGVEIIGHADPTPSSKDAAGQPMTTNWAISLSRAVAVASLMKADGYSRTLPVMGASSGLFDQLPKTLPEAEREALSRRVDLIINLHDNTFQQRFGIGPE